MDVTKTQQPIPKIRPDLITKHIDLTPKWLRVVGGRVFLLAVLIIVGVLIHGAMGGTIDPGTRATIETVFWGVVAATSSKKGLGAVADAIRMSRAASPAPQSLPAVEHLDLPERGFGPGDIEDNNIDPNAG